MTDTLTALDATFLELEEQSEGALMHTGGVMVFDPLPAGGAPTVENLCALVTGRLAGLPRYSLNLGVLAYGIEEGIEELLELAGASRLKPADATAKHLTHT